MLTDGNTIRIGGAGMVSALGFDNRNSCASARAGIGRASDLMLHNFAIDDLWGGNPIKAHAVSVLSSGTVGFAKALLLSRHALVDLLATSPFLEDHWDRTAIYLNVSNRFLLDWYASQDNDWDNFGASEVPSIEWQVQCNSLLPRLLSACSIDLPKQNQHLVFGDHTGVATAMREAQEDITSGRIDFCILGGVDSFVDLAVLEAAANAGMLRTDDNPAGFAPGEAAAFVVLHAESNADAPHLSNGVTVGKTYLAKEESNRMSEEPATGTALARVLGDALAEQETLPVLVIGDLNGDVYRATDWGYAVTRLGDPGRHGGIPLWLPAVSFGEVGAAAGVVAMAMVQEGRARGYVPNGRIVIWLMSDDGSRAALTLE